MFGEFQHVISKARENVPLTVKLFANTSPNVADIIEKIKTLEKEGDDLSFNLSEKILKGAINPAVLRDLLHIADRLDDIFDDYYFIAREVNRTITSKTGLPLHDKMMVAFTTMTELADKEFDIFGKLLSSDGLDEIQRLRREIEKFEEEGDNIKDSAFDLMYENQGILTYIQFQHYTEILRKLDDILDKVEDMSDLILAIVNTISR